MSEIALLQRREYPHAKYPFLRCQLGRTISEKRLVGHQELRVPIFHLLGYGETWDAATEMAARSQRPAAPEPEPVRGGFASFFASRA